MKIFRVALIVPTLLLTTSALAGPPETGTAREVPDFDGVKVSHGLKARVTVGPKSVRISGDEKKVSQVRTEVVDGKLVVRMEKNSWFGNSTRGIEVTISNPQLTSVEASGGAEVDAEATATDTFTAEASGGGDVSVRNVDAKQVKAEVSGGGELTLRGRADALEGDVSGGAELHARELSLKSLNVDASGGAKVEANPTERIEADASGGSSVYVDAAPTQREVSTSGGAEVVFRKK